jgi:hypothetical protein
MCRTSCPSDSCGVIDDNCGGTLSCPDCPTGQTCNPTTHTCEAPSCTPRTCGTMEVGSRCGVLSDGCEGTITCSCPRYTQCNLSGRCDWIIARCTCKNPPLSACNPFCCVTHPQCTFRCGGGGGGRESWGESCP